MSRAIFQRCTFIMLLGACAQAQAPFASGEPDAAPAPRKVSGFDNPEARRALERVRGSLSHSTTGLKLERRAHAAPRVYLQGRFHTATIAVRDAQGHVQRHCVEDPEQLDTMLRVGR